MRTSVMKGILALAIGTLACSSGEISGLTSPGTGPTGGTPPGSTVGSVVMTPPASTDMAVGQTITLVAAVLSNSGLPMPAQVIAWSSSDPSVASVSATAAITALKMGTTVITGSSSGKSVSVTINVTTASVGNVIVTVQTALMIGQSATAQAIATDPSGVPVSGHPASWSSRNPGTAIVSSSGMVTGISSGTTIIDAVIDGVQGSANVQVAAAAVSGIAVSLSQSGASIGQPANAIAVLTDANGTVLTGRLVAWTSSNTGVATISAYGIITAVAPGTTTITASSEGKTGTASFTVTTPSAKAVASVSLSVLNSRPGIGTTTQVNATLHDVAGSVLSNRPIVWASSNPAVATVSQTGLVTATGFGTATISATSETVTATVAIQVIVPPVTSVNVVVPPPTLQPTQTTQLVVTLKDANSTVLTGRLVTYASSNPTVATVSATGFITAIARGAAVVTVTSEGVVSTLTITVPPVARINVSAGNAVLQPSATTQVSALLLDGSGTPAVNRVLTWSSSNPAVATVSATGVVTAVAKGTANITATSEGVTGSMAITVPTITTITVSAPNASALQPAQVTQAAATLVDANGNPATNRIITWSSGTPSVATVSATGVVTAVAVGTSIISVSSEGVTGTLSVVIPAVSTVTVTAPATSLSAGATTQASASLRDANNVPATNRAIVWSSSAPAVATVSSSGLVTAVAVGTATISAVSEGKTGTLVVTVGGGTPVVPPTPTPAALPQVYINSAAPAAPSNGGVVIPVAAGGNLQAALNAAQPGDVIELAPGAIFTGNYTLPNKNTTSTNWIVIRPANWASLPAEGVRMTPSKAAALNLPRIQTPNTNNAILTALGAHHYRLIGLDVTVTPTNTYTYAAIALDGGFYQTTMASVVHDFVLDRMYVHGLPGLTLRRCVAMNSAWTAIVDSWISECHEKGSDSQAIASWNGPGPFKIVNNYLEGAGENIMFGGSDPSIPNMTPSDIEIRRNHVTKPLSWTGGVWSVKNLIEIKHGRRILIEGNIFENSWQESQNGVAIVIKSVNQGLQCTWCVTEDVNVRFNVVKNVGAGFNIAGAPDNVSPCPCIPARRITVNDNLITNMNVAPFLGDGRGFATYGSVTAVTITHNTMMSATSAAYVLGPTQTTQLGFVATNNLAGGGAYGLIGDNYPGAKAFSVYAPGGVFAGNVTILANSASMPVGNANTYPTTSGAVGFANESAGDYHLLSTSPYKLKGTDGKDPGADIDGVNTATAGVRVAP